MRSRSLLLLLGLIAILGGGYLASRSSWVRGWFVRDSENPAELARLADKTIEVVPVAERSSGWPQWRGPMRDGRAPAGPFRTDWDKSPPRLLWLMPCGGGYSSCAVVGGKLYSQDRKGGNERVFCLDAESGSLLWEYVYPAEYAELAYGVGPRATPSVVGNLTYAVGAVGKFICLEAPALSGQPTLRWQHDLIEEFGAKVPQWGVACSPLIEGDLAVVQPGGKSGSVVAFDRNTGERRWTVGRNPSGYSSPVAATIGGQRVIFALTGDALLALRPDGTITDTYGWVTEHFGNVATPLVVDEYVFISAAYSKGCALLRAEKQGDEVKLKSVYARLGRGYQNHHSTSVYCDRHLFGFNGMTSSARLKCIDFTTGTEKAGWEAEGIEPGSGAVIQAERHLIIQSERGDVYLVAATPEEFQLMGKLPKVFTGNTNWATPALVDGRLYLRGEGKLVCYDLRR